MKKKRFLLIITMLGLLLQISATACSRKSGCPAYDSLKASVNKKGELSTKSGKYSLFPKDMQKAGKKRKRD
jgi:hypothetical protein